MPSSALDVSSRTARESEEYLNFMKEREAYLTQRRSERTEQGAAVNDDSEAAANDIFGEGVGDIGGDKIFGDVPFLLLGESDSSLEPSSDAFADDLDIARGWSQSIFGSDFPVNSSMLEDLRGFDTPNRSGGDGILSSNMFLNGFRFGAGGLDQLLAEHPPPPPPGTFSNVANASAERVHESSAANHFDRNGFASIPSPLTSVDPFGATNHSANPFGSLWSIDYIKNSDGALFEQSHLRTGAEPSPYAPYPPLRLQQPAHTSPPPYLSQHDYGEAAARPVQASLHQPEVYTAGYALPSYLTMPISEPMDAAKKVARSPYSFNLQYV